MLYGPAHFEALTDEPWDPARIEEAIAAIAPALLFEAWRA